MIVVTRLEDTSGGRMELHTGTYDFDINNDTPTTTCLNAARTCTPTIKLAYILYNLYERCQV